MKSVPQREAESKVASWKVPQISIEIEYAEAVLADIAAEARASLLESPKGELEIGGVLFGEHEGGLVRIHTWRLIECQHSDGPGLRLLARDRVELACMLELARRTDDLRELQPVGWFVSHPRAGVRLTPSDLELFNGFFPYPWQITLALHPGAEGRIRAGFFVREAGGNLKSDASYREFDIEPLATVPAKQDSETIFSWAGTSQKVEATAPAQSGTVTAAAASPAFRHMVPKQLPAEASIPDEYRPSKKGRIANWIWVVAICLVITAAAALLVKQKSAPPYEPFPLRVFDSRQTLQVDWEHNSPLMQQARAAVLDVRDGGKSTRYALTPDELRAGSMSYVRQSDEVDLVMTVYPPTGPAVQGFGRLVAPRNAAAANKPPGETPAPAAPAENISELRAERDALKSQVARLDESVRKEAAEKNRLQILVRILENRLNVAGGSNAAPESNVNK